MNFRHIFNKTLKTQIPENPKTRGFFTKTRQKPENHNPDPTRTREVIPEPDFCYPNTSLDFPSILNNNAHILHDFKTITKKRTKRNTTKIIFYEKTYFKW